MASRVALQDETKTQLLENTPCWLLFTYNPVALFSLKTTYSTSSGGKTLLVPTPYAFKIAMVGAGFRAEGEKLARKVFGLIKGREVRFNPPEHLTVNHTFVKIKREPKNKTPEQPFTSSIAFREFCFFQGQLIISLDVSGLQREEIEVIKYVAAHVNYFGKQGSFFQFTMVEEVENLPCGFSLALPDELGDLDSTNYQVLQYLDDLGETQAKDLFERINTYSAKPIELHKHRILRQYLLPYCLKKENNRYTYYHKGI